MRFEILIKHKSMKNTLLLITFGLIVGCFNVWGEGLAAKITVETNDHAQQTIDVYESGKMYFSDDFLVIEQSENAESRQNPFKINLKDVTKLLFSDKGLSKTNDAYVSSFDLFPNPAKEFISVRTPFEEDSSYTILNMKGEVVKSGKISNRGTIDVTSLPAGMYLMNIGNMYIKFNKI